MPELIGPSLPCLDYLFVNEFEASQLAGGVGKVVARPDLKSLVDLAQTILARGVRKAVLVHVPDGVVCVQREGPVQARAGGRVVHRNDGVVAMRAR